MAHILPRDIPLKLLPFKVLLCLGVLVVKISD